jgi:8-oxo-dGTP diphosphatase
VKLGDIDWGTWRPHDVATLLFVIRRGEVLLIRKRRGLGAGKINAPGGRLEPGETPLQAALREVEEEVCVRPVGARERGELRFQFVDGYALACHVFSADGCEGEARETDEAVPQWVPLDALPYDQMWADDAVWLPLMLAGVGFSGRFVFEGDRMLDHALTLRDPSVPLFERLSALGIPSETVAHAPVFTVEHARRHRVCHEGLHLKNLFLRDKKGTMYLVSVREELSIDLGALGRRLGAGKLSFASYERLRNHLGVEPGSVTPLAVLHDTARVVTLVLDAAIPAAERVHCHPLRCDQTTSLRGADLVRFARATGHDPVVVDFDAR